MGVSPGTLDPGVRVARQRGYSFASLNRSRCTDANAVTTTADPQRWGRAPGDRLTTHRYRATALGPHLHAHGSGIAYRLPRVPASAQAPVKLPGWGGGGRSRGPVGGVPPLTCTFRGPPRPIDRVSYPYGAGRAVIHHVVRGGAGFCQRRGQRVPRAGPSFHSSCDVGHRCMDICRVSAHIVSVPVHRGPGTRGNDE